MSGAIEFQVKGLEEIRGKMRAISEAAQKKGGKAALRKAAKKIADRAKKNFAALDRSETKTSIEKNIAVAWSSKKSKGGDLAFRVGVIGGAKQYVNSAQNRRKGRVGGTYAVGGDIAKEGGGPGGDTFYWRFLEFGTSKIPAKSPMRHAADESGQESMNTFIIEMEKEITKAIARAKKVQE